jgi:hypothetical protein
MTDEAKAETGGQKLKVVIDRIEDGIATIVLYEDDRVHFKLPAGYLPEGTKDGDHFRLTFKRERESRDAEKKKADDLLKELLGQNADSDKKS